MDLGQVFFLAKIEWPTQTGASLSMSVGMCETCDIYSISQVSHNLANTQHLR